MNVTKCPKCEDGLMYPNGVYAHGIDNTVIRAVMSKCAHCGHEAVDTEKFVHVTAIKKRNKEVTAKVGL